MAARQLTEEELVHWELALRDEVHSWMQGLGIDVLSVLTTQTDGGEIEAIAKIRLNPAEASGDFIHCHSAEKADGTRRPLADPAAPAEESPVRRYDSAS